MNLTELRDALARAGKPMQPRCEPKGLQEVRFIGKRGDRRRAWLEALRTIDVQTNQKDKAGQEKVLQVELADLCVELRPGKFHSIEGVPNITLSGEANALWTDVRWASLEQLQILERNRNIASLVSRAAVQAVSEDAKDLGLKGA